MTGAGRARQAREATRLVADTIQSEYYYDESAGIGGLPREGHPRRQPAARGTSASSSASAATDAGPIGVGVAVVRGSELYVVTVGPVEAYLVRQAHLLTLPGPEPRAAACPSRSSRPRSGAARSPSATRWSSCRANVTRARSGRTSSRTRSSRSTRRPRSSTSTARFVAAGGTGSDGALAIEATRGRRHEPGADARPGPARRSRWPGSPDRSPIPLADSVGGGAAAAMARGATPGPDARPAARSARVVGRLQDLLPAPRAAVPAGHARRDPARDRSGGRPSPSSPSSSWSRRSGVGVVGRRRPGDGPDRHEISGRREGPRGGPGGPPARLRQRRRPHPRRPAAAEELLTDALRPARRPPQNGVPAATIAPLRARVRRRPRPPLRRRRGRAPDRVLLRRPGAAVRPRGHRPRPRRGAVRPRPRRTKTVYRIDLAAKKAALSSGPGPAARGDQGRRPRDPRRRAAPTS